MLVHRRLSPSMKFTSTHLYIWVERGTDKCPAQGHNTMSPARARTRTACFGVARTNHEAIAPPTLSVGAAAQQSDIRCCTYTQLWQCVWIALTTGCWQSKAHEFVICLLKWRQFAWLWRTVLSSDINAGDFIAVLEDAAMPITLFTVC